MKVNVLRLFAIMVALVIGAGAYAQEAGEMAVGGNLGVATGDGVTNFGIGAKFQYNVTKQIRGEGSFTYYLGDFNYWDLSANAHYLIGIPNVPRLNVYPLAGLSLNGYSGSSGVEVEFGVYNPYTGEWEYESDGFGGGGSGTTFGINLGGGAEYKLTDKISVGGELKYRIGFDDWNRFMISAGVTYRF